jgi:hypothetical protein
VRPALLAAPLALGLWLAACTDQARAPAEAALRAVDGSLALLTPEVSRYAPEQAAAARAAYAAALGHAGQGEWRAALAGAGDAAARVQEAVAAAGRARAEEARAWEQARQDVPNLLFAIEDRLDALEEAKRLPDGLERAALPVLRAELVGLQDAWDKVPAAAAGDPAVGLARANDLLARARALLARVAPP